MIDVIHWCLELGVPAVSVYAFSIDNFKRSPDEVGSLMELAEEKYNELARVGGQVAGWAERVGGKEGGRDWVSRGEQRACKGRPGGGEGGGAERREEGHREQRNRPTKHFMSSGALPGYLAD